MSGRAAAFFDLDRTLLAGSSGAHFARAAYRHGIVSRRQLAGWAVDGMRFRMRGATDEETKEVLKVARAMITGMPAADIDRLGVEVMASILPRIYPRMLDELYTHQDAGRATFIVSAASNNLVSALAAVIRADGAIGTSYEIDGDGLFTGRLDGPFVYGEGKVDAMRDFASEHGIDMDSSYAYSDAASDLPMLRAVGHPVAVNPDAELAAVAAEEGWDVMRFEKLGRRLAIAGTTVVALAVGGLASWLSARRAPPRRLAVPSRSR